MQLKIEVTQADIDKASELLETTSDPVSAICPVAIAANRVMKKPVVAGTRGIYDRRTFENYIPLPLEARTFIENFDTGVKVEPFSFEVQV